MILNKVFKNHVKGKYIGPFLLCLTFVTMYRFVPMEDSLQNQVSVKSESTSMFRRLNAGAITIPHVTSTPKLNYVLTNEPVQMQKCHATAKPTTSFGPLKHLHDFTPKVSSFNLNLLFMGDTVGSQYYEWLNKIISNSLYV